MNLLAHAYLSFDMDAVLVGNMISDFVKGKQKDNYPDEIKRGIVLHRKIDSFTDAHPVIAEARKVFRPLTGLYAGAFVDVAFDYFLANDANERSPEEWKVFSQKVYRVLAANRQWLPEKFARFFPYMQQEDWLYHYRFLWGIEKSFHNVLRRARYLPAEMPVMQAFEANLPLLEVLYYSFFPQLKLYTKETLAVSF